ncbi:MAG: NAD(P)H-dependent oxidoreductase subunit E [Bryobacteraceae bacterium]|nr:NAD(P)H-dependent oxidoreductase subunit E [Bryobacteraceae bacterium]
MDLRFTSAAASERERAAVDRAAGSQAPARDLLLPALQEIQRRIGWISPGALNYACRRLDVPPADGFGVASFYGLLSTAETGSIAVHVCDDLACRSESLIAGLERSGVPVRRSPCLGLCDRAPAALVTIAGEEPREIAVAPADASSVMRAVRGLPAAEPAAPIPQFGSAGLRLLRRAGQVDPESLDAYRASGGLLALRRARQIGPREVIREVRDARLAGRGGAAFPAADKWAAVAANPAPRYLVINADESEPGTFKDRVLMESDPFAVVEAAAIAAFATGCARIYFYIRGEYPLATERIRNAVDRMRHRGFLDGLDIEIRRGAGAYICGEETALFQSIEGYRGEPRSKPPFPAEAGLFRRPTLVNNVETLVNVPGILIEGGPAYARRGTERSTGTKLYCVSGDVERPGVYEFEFGITLRNLLRYSGCAIADLRGVLVGGAAGTFVTPDELDVPLTFEGLRAIGSALGSAVVMAFSRSRDMRGVLARIAHFFREESCGQCVPCRVGTVRQVEALKRGDTGLVKEVGRVMRDASICGLGQTASSAIESALARWPELMKEMR